MAKSKPREMNGTATKAPPAANPPSAPAEDQATEGNGNQKPVQVFSYPVAKSTWIQAAVWERVVKLNDGNSFTTHEVSVSKRWKNEQTGEWKTLHSFRGSELYALDHAVREA